MTKQPYINAIAAVIYIVLVVLGMNFATRRVGSQAGLLIPIAVLSMFTLSAAVMGYIFALQPLRMYLDGDKQGAVRLFLQTVGVFAVLTALLVLVLLFGYGH